MSIAGSFRVGVLSLAVLLAAPSMVAAGVLAVNAAGGADSTPISAAVAAATPTGGATVVRVDTGT